MLNAIGRIIMHITLTPFCIYPDISGVKGKNYTPLITVVSLNTVLIYA